MPPHCDTLDGPVVKAARKALETGNVNHILPWVHEGAEAELREAFRRATVARRSGGEAAELADLWFFETAVRLHRQGEGAPYNGLKPAGLDWGPVVPRAERAVETGDASDAIGFVVGEVRDELQRRFERAVATKGFGVDDVPAAREHVQAVLGFVLFSHHLWKYARSGGGHGGE